MRHDYHTHSTYSDGSFLWSMLSAAEEAGLAGVGIADHCNVLPAERHVTRKKAMGFNLDLTYERRREAIGHLRDRFDVQVFDAVELDYHSDDEEALGEFLTEAEFDYAIGSVHFLDEMNVHLESYFGEKDEAERRRLVQVYFNEVVELVESELFEITAHLDLVERNPALRGYATEEQYHRVAEALADSRTVPEVNAGRVHDEYGELHPGPEFLTVLQEHAVPFVLGSDAHEPEEIEPRKEELEALVDANDLETVDVVE